MMSVCLRITLTMGLVASVWTLPAIAREGKGTVTFASKSGPVVVTIRHAYLMKGPDLVSGKPIRRIVLSATDVGTALKACANMSCSDGGIGEGLTIDLDAGPRLNFWTVGNDQRVQHSGTAAPETLKLRTDTPQRVAGTWEFDGRSAGVRW